MSALFDLHVFSQCLQFILLLSFSFIPLRFDKKQEIIFMFLYVPRFNLFPRMWPILEQVPWAVQKNFYSVSVGWDISLIFVKSI